jgi:hypothetical protein
MALHLVVFAAFADGAQLPVTPLIRSDRLRAGGGSADIRLTSWLRVSLVDAEQASAVAPLGCDTAWDRPRETGRFPGVETADQVRDVAEAGTPQNTGGD